MTRSSIHDHDHTARLVKSMFDFPIDRLSDERVMGLVIEVSEKLDEIERRIDPDGPPPRHAAEASLRLRRLKKRRMKSR